MINHPFWGTPIFGNTHMTQDCSKYVPQALPPVMNGLKFVIKSIWAWFLRCPNVFLRLVKIHFYVQWPHLNSHVTWCLYNILIQICCMLMSYHISICILFDIFLQMDGVGVWLLPLPSFSGDLLAATLAFWGDIKYIQRKWFPELRCGEILCIAWDDGTMT